MREKWTGVLLGKMHNENISKVELGKEMGICKSYVSMILNGQRNPPGSKERMQEAYESILRKRKEGKANETRP